MGIEGNSTGWDRTGKPERMIVLALDTALDRTAVAVWDGARLAVRRVEAMDRGHAERLLPLLGETLAEAGIALADVERIVVTVGPGSFTGIRIAIAAARGLGLATGCPVVGVDTLSALARSVEEKPAGPVLAAIDARRGEIYAALFAPGGSVIEPPFVAEANRVLDIVADRAAVIVGSGAPILAHQAAIRGERVPPVEPLGGPDPLQVARLGAAMPEGQPPPAPIYLRPPDAKPQIPTAGLLG